MHVIVSRHCIDSLVPVKKIPFISHDPAQNDSIKAAELKCLNILRVRQHKQHLFRGKVNGASRTCKISTHAREKNDGNNATECDGMIQCAFFLLQGE